MISHQHVEAVLTIKQEAKRKQKALGILASARTIGFDHQTSELVWPLNTIIV
jgi:hypothetical protein